MPAPILATKLYVPPAQPGAVSRPRLIERLDEGLQRRLTLISAAAGFGKTTLLSEWVAGSGRPTAWLSLDDGDSDPARFLAYLVAALQTINVGEGVTSMLDTPQPPPTEAILTVLLNEIAAVPDDFVLVLDDYHVIDAEAVDDALAFLLEHLPPQVHLVIATREDPGLPLPRWRARGQLTEVRAADLRFTSSEAAEFLNRVMSLDLSAGEIAAVEGRTEGWIAGLQLAALSMRGREDVRGFIEAFAGDNRYVLDYLVEEVLERQPAHVRSFLLRTSILDRLSGPLCDAVTDQEESGALLGNLERGNLFVVPLDDTRHWFRERVVQAQWFAGRCDPARACSRGFRASGRLGRAGARRRSSRLRVWDRRAVRRHRARLRGAVHRDDTGDTVGGVARHLAHREGIQSIRSDLREIQAQSRIAFTQR